MAIHATCRAGERLRHRTEVRLAQRLGLAQVGFVELAMDLAVGHPVPPATLLAFFAGSECPRGVREMKAAVQIVG